MNNFSFKVSSYFISLFLIFSFFATDFAYADYQKIAPGNTITLGEFVFEDNFSPSTTDCTIGITDSLNLVVVASTTIMNERSDGWHYYDYTTLPTAASGSWRAIMSCGSAGAGDLVKVDKSFIVDSSLVSTTTIEEAISSINTNTDAQLLTASTSLAVSIPTNVWNATNRSLTTFGSLVADTATAVWASGTRSLTTFGTLVADVWTNTTRTLSGAGLDSGSLAVQSDVTTASSSLAAVINANTNAQISSAVSSLTAEIQSGWNVTLSDFGETTVNTAYKAKLQVLNYATIPTDADSLPTVVITDSVGTVQVNGSAMTKDSNGTYSYSYSIGGSAVGGVWETVVSVIINGETIKVNDYWSLSSSPADVQIIEITDRIIPFITANVRIDNMGTAASDFYYVYCIVSSEDNLCGGGDDIDSASDTAYINAGSFINLQLTLDEMTTAGTYWFKVKARALAETNWAASTEQFIAESGATPTPTPPPSGGGGGGGGGGGSVLITPTPTSTPAGTYNNADFNRDGFANSVDFSIMLFFWKTKSPFSNPYVDINKDGQVNSVDFSILLYQWGK